MVEAKLLRKKLKNGLIVDKWDLVTIIEKQQAEIEALKRTMEDALSWVQANDREKPFTGMDLCGEMVSIRLTGLCVLARAIGKRNDDELMKDWLRKVQEHG